jgi:hypothetical protein
METELPLAVSRSCAAVGKRHKTQLSTCGGGNGRLQQQVPAALTAIACWSRLIGVADPWDQRKPLVIATGGASLFGLRIGEVRYQYNVNRPPGAR